jgi:hypothetical protein
LIRAKEMRCGPGAIAEALREAANRGPSELVAERSPRARRTPCGLAATGYDVAEGHVGAAQIGSVVDRHTAGQLSCILIFTAEGSIAPQRPNVKSRRPCVVTLGDVTKITVLQKFEGPGSGYLRLFGLVARVTRRYTARCW